jgi:TatD DNase family protein
MIDTHAHFSREEAGYEVAEQLERGFASGVDRMIAVGGNAELNAAARKAALYAPERVHPVVGWDRDQAERWAGSADHGCGQIRELIGALGKRGTPVVGIGEMGLDYHYSAASAPEQRDLFAAQLALSRECGLPVVVHSREADEDTLALLGEHAAAWHHPGPPGVLHCFTGGESFARRLIELGMYISFSGILTFRNADSLRAVAASLPDEVLVVETDCPYLSPIPVRSSRCEPAFVRHTVACLADLRGVPIEEMDALTTQNANRLFSLTAGACSDV